MRARALATGAIALALGSGALASPGALAGTGYHLITAQIEGRDTLLRWNPCQDEITVQVNVDAAREPHASGKVARQHARNEIIRAVDRLADVTGLPFRYVGKTSDVPTGAAWYQRQDEQSEVLVAYVSRKSGEPHSSLLTGSSWGTGGQAYKTMDEDVAVGRGFVLIDADRTDHMARGFGAGAHRGNLVLHELGHVVGLGHVSDKSQLMNPLLTDKTPDGFADGDLAGLDQVGADQGCVDGAAELWPGS